MKVSLYVFGVALLAFAYALIAFLLRGEVVIEIQTGEDETFEMEKTAHLVLVDTNTGLGSSPGTINVDGGVRLFGPDGQECELDPDGYGTRSYHFGEYHLEETGTYRFVLDEIQEGDVRSRGALKTRDKLPGLGLAVFSGVACFVLAIPIAILGAIAVVISPDRRSNNPG